MARADGKLWCSTCNRALDPEAFHLHDNPAAVSDPDRAGRSFTCDDCWTVWQEVPKGTHPSLVRSVVLDFNQEG